MRLNDGFYNNWGHTYYFQKDGTRLDNGFYNNWGRTYYFGQGGVRLDDGFYNNWGHTYYFQKDGSRLDNGFYNNWGHTYYFGQGGVRLDDDFYNNWGHTYYFQKDGSRDGSRLDNGFYNNWGHTYYFGQGGVRWDNRWMSTWGNCYYFGNDGARITSQYFVVDGIIYFFDEQGIAHDDPLVTAWKTIINNYKGHNVAIAVQSQKDGIVHQYSNNPAHRFTMASTVKVAVLAQLLHNTNGNLNSYQQSLAERMIRNSDNNATTEIVKNYLGGVSRMSEIYSALGMSDTTPGYGNYWGLTTTTPVDQLKLLNQIYLAPYSNYLNDASRNYIKNLMGSVNADQNWGISAGSSQFYVKNGWLALSPSWRWYVDSIGFIPQDGNGYTIAVYTDNNLPMSTGVNLIELLARTTKKYI
nr:serine hydrolase [Limosilactobacillus reuteri]